MIMTITFGNRCWGIFLPSILASQEETLRVRIRAGIFDGSGKLMRPRPSRLKAEGAGILKP